MDTHTLPGVVLSEFKLRVPSVLLALIADRLLADRSVDAHGRNEQSWSPDASPIPVPLGPFVCDFWFLVFGFLFLVFYFLFLVFIF